MSKPATEGTRAFEYLRGARSPFDLLEDPELRGTIDDKHPDGGLLYVFNDGSCVVWKPTIN